MPAPLASAVLDVGSSLTKAGFAGEEAPRELFRTCIGVPRCSGMRATLLQHPTDIIAGDEAYRRAGLLETHKPVQHGHIVDFDAYEQLLFHTLYARLQVVPDQLPFLVLEPADQTRKDREHVAELFFEHFNAPLLGMLNTATATIYASGNTTGVCVDSGSGKTMIGAVADGYLLSHSMRPSYIAGDMLTEELLTALKTRGYPLSTRTDWALVEHMKETLCRVSTNLAEDQRDAADEKDWKSYVLPDQERIFIFDSEFLVSEVLFDPSRLQDAGASRTLRPPTPTGYSEGNPACRAPLTGWADTVDEVIQNCPISIQESLYGSVVLGGGTSIMKDVEKRLQKDLVQLAQRSRFSDAVVRCVALGGREQAAWIGGSVWASNATFPHMCLSKADYHENGAGCVHKYAF